MAKYADLHYAEKIERLEKKIADSRREIAKIKRENSDYFVVMIQEGGGTRYEGIGKVTLEDAEKSYYDAFKNAYGTKTLMAVSEKNYWEIVKLSKIDCMIEWFVANTYGSFRCDLEIANFVDDAIKRMEEAEEDLRAELGIESSYYTVRYKF